MTRSAHGLSTPVDEWRTLAACRNEDPELWFTESLRREAIHVCRAHCPVVHACFADAMRARPSHGVQGGEAWTTGGALLYGGSLQADRSCRRCLPDRPVKPRRAYAPRHALPEADEVRPAGLSPAELRVARLLRDTDLSSAEIAAQLQVSPETVKTQTRCVYRKVGVRCRAELQAALKEATCDH